MDALSIQILYINLSKINPKSTRQEKATEFPPPVDQEMNTKSTLNP